MEPGEGGCPRGSKGRVRERVVPEEGIRVSNASKEPSSLSLWMTEPSCVSHTDLPCWANDCSVLSFIVLTGKMGTRIPFW